MSREVLLVLVFVAATLLGYTLIKAVPSLLHTPLMSGMNALSGITVLGAITVTALSGGTLAKILGTLGIIAAVVNVVAGFGVTDRMLRMFKGKTKQSRDMGQ